MIYNTFQSNSHETDPKTSIFLIIILLFCLLIIPAGCSRSNEKESSKSQSLQIKGSDTIVNLVQAWAEEYSKANSSVNIGITGGGSGTGFAALLNSTCDIAMSSRPAEDKEIKIATEKKKVLKEFKIGLDGLVVIVNPDNPVSQLTLDQVRDIFMGNKTNWKYFGGNDLKIVILSRESNSGTHMFFKEHVLRKGNKKGKEEFSTRALLMPSSQTIVNELEQNPHAVGYVGMGYINPRLRAVAIAKKTSTHYVAPVIENVVNDSYPISRPLFLYTNGEPSGTARSFIDYALSVEGQVIVRKTDFVPIVKAGK